MRALSQSPYPWENLEQTSRTRVLAERTLRAAALRAYSVRDIDAVLSELFREPIQVTARRLNAPVAPLPLQAELHQTHPELHLRVEAEIPLAAELLAKIVGHTLRLQDPSAPVAPALLGGYAACLVELGKRLAIGSPPQLKRYSEAAKVNAAPAGEPLTVEAVVATAKKKYQARVSLRGPAAPPEPLLAASPQTALETLGNTPITLGVFVGHAFTSAEELAAAEPGDFWVPSAGLTITTDLHGHGNLQSVTGSRECRVDLSGGKIVVSALPSVSGSTTAMPHTPSEPMNADAIKDAALDASVLVRVQVAEVTLTARAWAHTEPGDVLETTTPVGSNVDLVVGGSVVASGELVVVDGNLGVRVTRRV